MYDLSKEFNSFYKNHVVLPNDKQNELRKKKNLNINRLESGLKEYNTDNGTDYKISETRVQGSMAMSTVVQNDSNDYDIDVAIVFEKVNLNGMGPGAVKNVIVDALKRKCTNFKAEPEAKTNCVRIIYQDGYHVDFAIYQRYKEYEGSEYSYEHAGSSWSPRNPSAINNWFSAEIKDKGDCLRKCIRFSKMFCKSRSSWVNMPGGLLQTVLCDEKIQNTYTRIDECFYYTMNEVKERLANSIEVYNPTDTTISLLLTQNHRTEMINWLSRLSTKLVNLNILFDSGCTYENAKNAWYDFFNHTYWQELSTVTESASMAKSYTFRNTEEFIEDKVNINEQYYVNVSCKVSANGFQLQPLFEFLSKFNKRWLPHGFSIDFDVVDTNVPEPYDVWWKVRNVGPVAEQNDNIRGQIETKFYKHKHETSSFYGAHYVECYIIKNGECVAIAHVDVPIDNN